jgi:hypothetical protein
MMAPVNRRQFEEIRRWGDALRRDEREELRAAGEAIRLLCEEIDRLGSEVAASRAAAAELLAAESAEDGDTMSDEPELIESSLRGRLQRRLGALHR